MQTNYFFKHDFFRTVFQGFIGTLDNLFHEYKEQHLNNDKFPIFINSTGDEVYLSNMTSIGKGGKGKDLYEYTPRLVLGIGGFAGQADQLTAPGIQARLQVADDSGTKYNALSHLRRIPFEIPIKGEVVFSKMHEMLSFIEFYYSAISHTALGFEILHGGTVHQIVFDPIFDFDGDVNHTLGFDSDKRGIRMPMNFVIGAQFPAYNLYKAKGFNYLEQPGVVLDGSGPITDDDLNGCNNCQNCAECGDPDSGRGMMKIIHHMHINDPSPKGIVSTQIIDKSNK